MDAVIRNNNNNSNKIKTGDSKNKLLPSEFILVILVFCICLSGALLLPVDQCPDENGRLMLSRWIIEKGTLPTGKELEVMIPGWGFSYALRPYISSIIGAIAYKLISPVCMSESILLASMRICSVVSIAVCSLYCILLGHKLFSRRMSALVFAGFICCTPQVLFLGMYQNNDSLSLCAVSIVLYYLAQGHEQGWSFKSCIGIGIGYSLALLSYYSIWGWLLIGFAYCLFSVYRDKSIKNKTSFILVRGGVVIFVCIALASWFFIRNAYYNQGDFLGITTEAVSREEMANRGYELFEYWSFRDEGISALEFLRFNKFGWITVTAKSFVGVFGYLAYFLPSVQYWLYLGLTGLGIVLFFISLNVRRPSTIVRDLLVISFLSSLITFGLHFWQSYARDYQAQGRYVITIVIFIGLLVAYSSDSLAFKVGTYNSRDIVIRPGYLIFVGWIILAGWACLGTMSQMIM